MPLFGGKPKPPPQPIFVVGQCIVGLGSAQISIGGYTCAWQVVHSIGHGLSEPRRLASTKSPQANSGASSEPTPCRCTYSGSPDVNRFASTPSSREVTDEVPSAKARKLMGCSILPNGTSRIPCSWPPCASNPGVLPTSCSNLTRARTGPGPAPYSSSCSSSLRSSEQDPSCTCA